MVTLLEFKQFLRATQTVMLKKFLLTRSGLHCSMARSIYYALTVQMGSRGPNKSEQDAQFVFMKCSIQFQIIVMYGFSDKLDRNFHIGPALNTKYVSDRSESHIYRTILQNFKSLSCTVSEKSLTEMDRHTDGSTQVKLDVSPNKSSQGHNNYIIKAACS